jgi:hypothetical protein
MTGMPNDRPVTVRLRKAFLCCLAVYAVYAAFACAFGALFLPEESGWTAMMLEKGAGGLMIGMILGCGIGWLGVRNSQRGWRFSLRDLLVAMTLFGATLGYVVYALRK